MYQLPETVEDLIRLIGEAETLKLLQAHPKVIIDIPRNPTKAMVLQETLTFASVEALCAYYDGDRIYIPDAANILRIRRDDCIREEHGRISVRDLAMQYGLSYRRIQQIQATDSYGIKSKVDENQGMLF